MNRFSHIRHRELKIPITKKGKYKIYIRFTIDSKKMKMYIRSAFLSSGKKETQLEVDIPAIEELNAVMAIPELPEFNGKVKFY